MVNEDAASCLTDIAAFTESTGARDKWTVTRIMRSAIVGHLLKLAGLTQQEDISWQLKANCIKHDNEDLKKLIKDIEETMNPFAEIANDSNLCNISTGRAVSDSVKKDLFNCIALGET